ncbi:sulfite exporter TauE/SafE family protein [Octadecabacter ascidiaceicola]|uniref:Probable membrane transporter protein n=1 Tax=Octadecabacter ascidiaceicola TaxID=1655543 RepID=A0A238K9M8_9RHOB|nr:sulfite exporter TauE/SafE family protein [Octadecabacter ascidiaceicola]SMX39177.1 Sulfite exporter TauE/SafE [Octadecabacter ascidiaceicola]
MDGTIFWMAGIAAAFCVGLSKGGVPAFGMLGVPLLSLVISPVAAAGLLLPVFVFSDVFGVWAYRKEFSRDVVRIAVPGILFGGLIGWVTASIVSEQFVRLLIGFIGAVFALSLLMRRAVDGPPRPATWGQGLFWTSVAGFTSFVSHAGAPPWQIWVLPQGLSKMVFAGTTTIVFAIMNASKIVPYYFLGQLAPQNLRVAALLFLPAVVAVFVGYRLVKIMPDRVFFNIVAWTLLLVSVKLIWDGTFG